MITIAGVFILIYSFGLFYFLIQWERKESEISDVITIKQWAFSVIICVRNEEKNIADLLESLANQYFENFEVILIDDASEDKTVEIAKQFVNKLDLQIIKLEPEERGNAPKKNGIAKAIGIAKYDLIFCTDGDCILPSHILNKYANLFDHQEIMFISGPVSFKENAKTVLSQLWENIQIVEFASLVGSAAVSIFTGKPNMCSGANIAYRKSVFYEVGGYQSNEHLASGDDEFLMHKISEKYPKGIEFAKSEDCIVETNASENIAAFYNQRKRWASKWTHYKSIIPKLLAAFIFFVNLSTIYLAVQFSFKILLIRFVLEFTFLGAVLLFMKKKKAIFYIPLVQILYPFYVVFFGVISIFMSKTYKWKSRELR
ncbi:glycosyltransferase [Lacihabitans sp. LS3-19]|uniref:glycosyltransferase n=1 Tax=Lacihabitans sp. LS3-19 TaxID=2487335 RepID=UPI0020CB6B4E|nr:glycosyltransferase [Lacihabitans sp. LS3-19]MCP9768891.1 glycosyltransferase [Lacihabitans sp. LS3-19]